MRLRCFCLGHDMRRLNNCRVRRGDFYDFGSVVKWAESREDERECSVCGHRAWVIVERISHTSRNSYDLRWVRNQMSAAAASCGEEEPTEEGEK